MGLGGLSFQELPDRERRTVARHRRRIYQKLFLMVYQAVLYHAGQVRPIAAAGTVSASALFAITCQEPPGVEKSTIRLGVRVWFESFCEGATGRDAFRRFSPGLKFLFSNSFRGFSFRAQISCSKSFRRFSPRPQEGFTMKIWFSEVFFLREKKILRRFSFWSDFANSRVPDAANSTGQRKRF